MPVIMVVVFFFCCSVGFLATNAEQRFRPVSNDDSIDQLDVTSSSIPWTTCPPEQGGSSFHEDCATLQFPLDRSNPSLGSVDAFIRRIYVDQPTNDSLWFVAGGPGYSTRGDIPVADYFLSLNANLTAYLQDVRGTGMSSLLSCNNSGFNPGFWFNPYNASEVALFSQCNDYVKQTFGSISHYFTPNTAALDLRDVMNLINPNIKRFYAASYGTYFMNVFLQTEGVKIDCLVLDGPIPPNRWPLEDNALWNTHVSQDLVSLCVQNSSVCRKYLGQMGHLPQLVNDAVIDGTLPCLRNLTWLAAKDGHIRTTQFTNFMTGYVDAHPLLGPFWYRLYRCSVSDIEQLNYFYQTRIAQMYPNVIDVLDYSYGLGTNIGVNEIYSFQDEADTLTYDDQLVLTGRMFSSGNGELTVSYAKYVSQYPKYTPSNETYLKFVQLPYDLPILILVGTLDPNTEQGLGPWYKDGLQSNFTTLLTVPYQSHGIVSNTDFCMDEITADFINSLGTATLNLTCMYNLPPPDFDGSDNSTKAYSLQYFGTTDLWNDGYQKDSPVDNSCTTTIFSDDDSNSWSDSEVTALICGLVIPFSVIIIGLLGYIIYIGGMPSLYKPSGLKENLIP